MLSGSEAGVLALEFLCLTRLAIEDLSDLDTGEVLGEEGIDVRGRILYLTVSATGELSEYECEKKDKRSEAKHHQCELIVEDKHRAEDTDDGKAILHEVNKKIGEHHGYRVGIVGNSCYKLSYGDLVQLGV